MARRLILTSLTRFFLFRPHSTLAIGSLISVLPIVLLGTPGGDDAGFHLQTWLDVSSQRLLLPRWAEGANFGFGDVRLIFYPPLSWLLGGNLFRFLPPAVVPGIFIFLCALISSFGMYWLARLFFSSNKSLIAGVAYTLSPYFLFDIYQRAAYAESLATAILPIAVCCLLRLRRHHGFRDVAFFSFSLGLILLANIPLAIIASLTLAALTCLEFGISRNPRFLTRAAAGALIAVALTAFYWIPVVAQRTWNNPERLVAAVTSVNDFLPPLAFADIPGMTMRVIAITCIQAGPAIFLIVWVHRKRRTAGDLRRIVTLLAVLSAVMMLPVSLPIWKLPVLRYMEIPFRWLSVVGMLYAFAAVYAFSRWRRTITAGTVLGVLSILCLPVFKHPEGLLQKYLEHVRRSTMNGEGYEDVVTDWNPRQFNLDFTSKDLPLASFVPGNAGASSFACGPDNIHVALWSAERKIIDAHCPQGSVLRFHLAYYPLWKVVANGKTVDTFYDHAGVLEVLLPAGRNQIDVSLRRPAFETAGCLLSLLTLGSCMCLIFVFPVKAGPAREHSTHLMTIHKHGKASES